MDLLIYQFTKNRGLQEVGQIIGEPAEDVAIGDFTLAPIPILNNIYDFDLFMEHMGLIADRIQTVDL